MPGSTPDQTDDDIYWDNLALRFVNSVAGAADLATADALTLRIAPNPFNAATTLQFALHEEAEVSARIYDVRGHLVHVVTKGGEPGQPRRSLLDFELVAQGVVFEGELLAGAERGDERREDDAEPPGMRCPLRGNCDGKMPTEFSGGTGSTRAILAPQSPAGVVCFVHSPIYGTVPINSGNRSPGAGMPERIGGPCVTFEPPLYSSSQSCPCCWL